MKKICAVFSLISILLIQVSAQEHRYDPPWNTPPENTFSFTIAGIDNVPDLFGDVNDPQLVLFFAGNQFMCMDDLLAAFKEEYPQYQRIFVETLPPGILARQMEVGSLTMGNMRITLKPDIYTAGRNGIVQMASLFTDTLAYAYNKLAIMIAKGNPKKITGLKDLGRKDIRVSMPNPSWEGVSKQIEQAYVKAGGETLRKTIMETKVKDSSTYFTQIHHRQTPMRILYDQSDAGPVWLSEVVYQKMINHPIEMVSIPDSENVTATFMAGLLKTAPHPQAAKDFMNFLQTATAKTVYKKYGFAVE